MIGAVLFGLLVGLGIPAVIFFIFASGMDSGSGFVRMLTVIPMGAFVSGSMGFVIIALTETKDVMGNVVGNPWQAWLWITVLGTSVFAIVSFLKGLSEKIETGPVRPPIDADTDPEDEEIERLKWEISNGVR